MHLLPHTSATITADLINRLSHALLLVADNTPSLHSLRLNGHMLQFSSSSRVDEMVAVTAAHYIVDEVLLHQRNVQIQFIHSAPPVTTPVWPRTAAPAANPGTAVGYLPLQDCSAAELLPYIAAHIAPSCPDRTLTTDALALSLFLQTLDPTAWYIYSTTNPCDDYYVLPALCNPLRIYMLRAAAIVVLAHMQHDAWFAFYKGQMHALTIHAPYRVSSIISRGTYVVAYVPLVPYMPLSPHP